jgi:hypothetical protein
MSVRSAAQFENPLSFEDESSDGRPASFEGESRGRTSKAGEYPSRSPTQKTRGVFGASPAGASSPPADVENVAIDDLGDMTTQQVIGLFKSLDIDGNGVIDEEEMAIMMTRLGKPADEEAVLDMMTIMDTNNDGGVELEVSHST